MGWWTATKEGESLATEGELLWGDGPADIMDGALKEIVAEFNEKQGRKPTLEELQSGLLFSAHMLVDVA